jgi:hypothetical protein
MTLAGRARRATRGRRALPGRSAPASWPRLALFASGWHARVGDGADDATRTMSAPPASTWHELQDSRAFPVATVALLAITITVTLVQIAVPELRLHLWRDQEALRSGELWRLATPLLIQYDPWRDAAVVLGLIAFIGTAVERVYGARRLLGIYVTCGVGVRPAGTSGSHRTRAPRSPERGCSVPCRRGFCGPPHALPYHRDCSPCSPWSLLSSSPSTRTCMAPRSWSEARSERSCRSGRRGRTDSCDDCGTQTGRALRMTGRNPLLWAGVR